MKGMFKVLTVNEHLWNFVKGPVFFFGAQYMGGGWAKLDLGNLTNLFSMGLEPMCYDSKL